MDIYNREKREKHKYRMEAVLTFCKVKGDDFDLDWFVKKVIEKGLGDVFDELKKRSEGDDRMFGKAEVVVKNEAGGVVVGIDIINKYF